MRIMQNRYVLKKYIHWEPDEYPNPEQWLEVEKILKTHNASIMILEDEPLPETSQKLQEMKLKKVVFNPCGNVPDNGNYLSVMNSNIDNLIKEID